MERVKGFYKKYSEMVECKPKIGRLQIIEFSHKNKWGNVYLSCKCECGNLTTVDFSSLNREKTLSCGCLQKEKAKDSGLKNRKYFINPDSLIENDTTSYILGLLAADGSYEKAGLSLTLKDEDLKIIENIKKYFSYTGPITYRKNKKYSDKKYAKILISDSNLLKFINERGIIKNKSFNYLVPDIYKFNKHFWRGFVDGDGCIFNYNFTHSEGYKYNYYGFSLCGTLDTVNNFKIFCESIIGNINVNPYEISNSSNTYSITFVGARYLPILEYLYSEVIDDMYLDRKYFKYLEIKDKFFKGKIHK